VGGSEEPQPAHNEEGFACLLRVTRNRNCVGPFRGATGSVAVPFVICRLRLALGAWQMSISASSPMSAPDIGSLARA
jgi:hypothetical protein